MWMLLSLSLLIQHRDEAIVDAWKKNLDEFAPFLVKMELEEHGSTAVVRALRNTNGCFLVVSESRGSGGSVLGRNMDYYFELNRHGPDGQWELAELVLLEQQGEGDAIRLSKLQARIRAISPTFFQYPWSFSLVDPVSLLSVSKFETRETREGLILSLDVPAKTEVQGTKVTFSRLEMALEVENGYLPTHCRMHNVDGVVGLTQEYKWGSFGEFTWNGVQLPGRLVVSTSMEVEGEMKVDSSSAKFIELGFSDHADSEFYVAAFGLPEPALRDRTRFPWWLFLVFGGAALVAFSLWSKRHAT